MKETLFLCFSLVLVQTTLFSILSSFNYDFQNFITADTTTYFGVAQPKLSTASAWLEADSVNPQLQRFFTPGACVYNFDIIKRVKFLGLSLQ